MPFIPIFASNSITDHIANEPDSKSVNKKMDCACGNKKELIMAEKSSQNCGKCGETIDIGGIYIHA